MPTTEPTRYQIVFHIPLIIQEHPILFALALLASITFTQLILHALQPKKQRPTLRRWRKSSITKANPALDELRNMINDDAKTQK